MPVGSYDQVTDTLLWFNHTEVIFQGERITAFDSWICQKRLIP